MNQWLKKSKRRGFTLVELLIVIVIIGILAGSLLLVMGSGTDKANATKVVSDMRTLKAAMLMYYADNDTFVISGDTISSLSSYLDRDPSTNLGTYTISTADDPVQIIFTATDNTAGYFTRLSGMAAEAGITIAGSAATMNVTNP